MDVSLHWRGSVTDFVTDLVQGALSRRELVSLTAELTRRGYGGEPECPAHGTTCHGAACALRDAGVAGRKLPPAALGPEVGFSCGHSVISKLRAMSAGSGGEAELTSISRLEHGTATLADLERLTPIARDAGLSWGMLFPEFREGLPRGIRCSTCELVHASDVTCGQAIARDTDRRLKSRGHINPITSVAARDFDLAGPCPERCSCDESAWLRGRLRSVSRKALQVAELARGGAEAGE